MSSGLGGASHGQCQLGKSSFCLATSMTDGVPRCTSVVHWEPPAGEDWGVLLYKWPNSWTILMLSDS